MLKVSDCPGLHRLPVVVGIAICLERMDMIAYVNRVNTWPEYVRMSNKAGTASSQGESRVLCRFVIFSFISLLLMAE